MIVKDGVSDPEAQVFDGLKSMVKSAIGSFAVPHYFLVRITVFLLFFIHIYLYSLFVHQLVPGLPKTRSGKIMRRILRKIATNLYEELGDVSTLANPPIVKDIMDKWLKVAAASNNNGDSEQ